MESLIFLCVWWVFYYLENVLQYLNFKFGHIKWKQVWPSALRSVFHLGGLLKLCLRKKGGDWSQLSNAEHWGPWRLRVLTAEGPDGWALSSPFYSPYTPLWGCAAGCPSKQCPHVGGQDWNQCPHRWVVNCSGQGSSRLLARDHLTGRNIYLQIESLGKNSNFMIELHDLFIIT